MSNNKQSSVEYYIEKILDLDYEYAKGLITLGVWSERKNALIEQAKSMHKKETIDFALHCMMPKLNPDKSTIATISDIYDEIFNK